MRKDANTQLYKVRLNSQGYTSEGYYFGAGQQLWYWQYDADGVECGYVRASNRWDAKADVEEYLRGRVQIKPVFYR